MVDFDNSKEGRGLNRKQGVLVLFFLAGSVCTKRSLILPSGYLT